MSLQGGPMTVHGSGLREQKPLLRVRPLAHGRGTKALRFRLAAAPRLEETKAYGCPQPPLAVPTRGTG